IIPPLRAARQLFVVATLAATLMAEIEILRHPIGTVLVNTYVADRVSALWGILFVAATLLAWLFSVHYYRDDRPFQGEHDFLMLVTPLGMILMAGAQDLIVFFVGLEVLSIPLYALAAFRRNNARSIEAGLKYFLLGAFAAAFFLYGAGLIYMASGSVTFADLRGAATSSPVFVAGVGLVMASVFFKVSVFPFHLWVPDVYEGSPTPVTALMATGTKAAAFAFLLNAAFLIPASQAALIVAIAVITMAIGNLGALVQSDVKRMLAYSGIAHAGTILLVVAGYVQGTLLREAAVDAAMFYLGAYVFTAAGAFGLLATLERDGEDVTTFESLKGLAHRRPLVAAAMSLFMLSLGGIPLTGGFLGKWFVFGVSYRAGFVAATVIGALISVVGMAYYLRVIVAMYMQAETKPAAAAHGQASALPMALATAVCVAFVIAMGVAPGYFLP
ncbi:MAG: NADH-quinone oxidoreductase subunit N, partial [Planctomycetota bacterium]